MFTGIIQHMGRVATMDANAFGAHLIVDACGWPHEPATGDSIAVNGCCLTVTRDSDGGRLRFDVIHQTLQVTAMGDLRPGDSVNLEHALSAASLLGGHIVQGHVDGVGIVRQVAAGGEHRLRIQPQDRSLLQAIIEKGSIAVDGVSLTVAATGEDWFEVALIPVTLQITNLGRLKIGSRVNLETDYLAKVVVNYLRRRGV